MNNEKLIPVASESELRVGMIVVVRDCESCGREWCRSMFTGRAASGPCVSCGNCRVFLFEPSCCGDNEFCLSGDFEAGAVFRVDDGLDPDADAARMKEDLRQARNVREAQLAQIAFYTSMGKR